MAQAPSMVLTPSPVLSTSSSRKIEMGVLLPLILVSMAKAMGSQSMFKETLDCPWVITDSSAFLVSILIMSGPYGRSSTARLGGVQIKAIRSTNHSWGGVTQQARMYRLRSSEQPMRVVTPQL